MRLVKSISLDINTLLKVEKFKTERGISTFSKALENMLLRVEELERDKFRLEKLSQKYKQLLHELQNRE